VKKYVLLLSLATSVLVSCKSDGQTNTGTEPKPAEEEMDGDPDMGDLSVPGTFYDKFETELDPAKWEKMNQLWGQSANVAYQHGGVIPENVYIRGGHAVMRALGDQYTGTLRGPQGHSKRLGGVLKSVKRFASGRYEFKMRILQAPDMGVVSAAWNFWYKEITETADPAAWKKAVAAGNIVKDGKIALNHEIDIEVKGAKLGNPIYTNWVGEKEGEFDSKNILYPAGLADQKFHVYRWDWHTGGNGQEARVEYYVDNQLIRTSNVKVPYIASYMNIGNWFAWWAGNDSGTYKAPAFDSMEMFVDWVKFTPFNEPNDDFLVD
jgi:hypothetical protein